VLPMSLSSAAKRAGTADCINAVGETIDIYQ